MWPEIVVQASSLPECTLEAWTGDAASVIVAMESLIEVKNLSERLEVFLNADGQVQLPLATGDTVRIRRAEEAIRLVRLPGSSFFKTLRNKLNWSGSSI